MIATNGEDWAWLLVKSNNKCLSSMAVFMLVHPCRLQLVKPASQAAERNNQSIVKIDKNNTTKNHNEYHYKTSSDSENLNENHSSDSEDEGYNLTHHHQPLIVFTASTNKPFTTHYFLRSHRKTNRSKTPSDIITRAPPRKPQKDQTKHAN